MAEPWIVYDQSVAHTYHVPTADLIVGWAVEMITRVPVAHEPYGAHVFPNPHMQWIRREGGGKLHELR